jgi:Tfp pilus assembly protein PilF
LLLPIYTHIMPARTTEDARAEADTLFDLALDRMAAGSPAQAIAPLRRALELDPSHAAASHGLIRALEDSGQVDEALALTRRRIAADPDDVLAHTRLSILLQKLGDVPAAEAAAAQAKILGWKLELREGI